VRRRSRRIPKLHKEFTDIALIELALTHKSLLGDTSDGLGESNERLEFLGDAVLGLIVAVHLYSRHAEWTEGDLAKARSRIVCEDALAQAAATIDLGSHVAMGKGEEQSGGRERPSALANAMEAVIGAIYLDRGIEAARDFVLEVLGAQIRAAESATPDNDFKSRLQELCQARLHCTPMYRIVEEGGSDHAKTFVAEVSAADRALGHGNGRSKKEAEQAAARQALARKFPDPA
jgi:ribonuclease III